MMQWTGPALQVIAVPWTRISDAASANAFADKIAAAPRALFGGGTSISGAIDTGMALLFDNPYRGDAARDRYFGRRLEQSRALGQSGARRGGAGRRRHQRPADPRARAGSRPLFPAERDRRPGRVRDRREGFRDLRRGDPEEADRGDRRDRSAPDAVPGRRPSPAPRNEPPTSTDPRPCRCRPARRLRPCRRPERRTRRPRRARRRRP